MRAELFKILAARRGAAVMAEADGAGLLGAAARRHRATGAARPRGRDRGCARDAEPDAGLRLAALAVGRCAKTPSGCANGCASPTPRASASRPSRAAFEALHGLGVPPTLGALRVALFERGRPGATDALTLAHAESAAAPDDARWLSAWRFLRDTPIPRLPFTGAELVARGMAPGRGVGEALKALQAKWIRAGFPREPETLARLLAEALRGFLKACARPLAGDMRGRSRRGGRAAEGARLESVYAGNRIAGSNPASSARS